MLSFIIGWIKKCVIPPPHLSQNIQIIYLMKLKSYKNFSISYFDIKIPVNGLLDIIKLAISSELSHNRLL